MKFFEMVKPVVREDGGFKDDFLEQFDQLIGQVSRHEGLQHNHQHHDRYRHHRHNRAGQPS